MVSLIVNRGRSFIYSTGLVPSAAGQLLCIKLAKRNPEAPEQLREKSTWLRSALQAAVADKGWTIPDGITHYGNYRQRQKNARSSTAITRSRTFMPSHPPTNRSR